jgi:hypothetical protein
LEARSSPTVDLRAVMEGGGSDESKGLGPGLGAGPGLAELYQTKHRRELILHSLIASFSALDLVDPQATRVFVEALQGQGLGLGREDE